MKQLRLLPIFFFFVLLTVSCREDEPEEPILKESPDLNNPESIERYFQSVEEHRFMMSRLLLADSALISQKCPFGDVRCDTVYFTNLNQAKRECRQDDLYRFDYSNGSLEGFIDDASLVCNSQEVGSSRAYIVDLSDSRLVGEVTFELEQNQAVNRFFGFFLESTGASSNYDMVWSFTHLGPDSINVTGEFTSGYLPDVNIQFTPI